MVFRALRERARRASCQLDGQGALRFKLYALRSTVYELVLKLSSFSFSLVCILTLVLYNTSSSYELCIRLELEYELVVHLRADLSSDYPEIFLTILQDRRTYISYHIRRKEWIPPTYAYFIHASLMHTLASMHTVCILCILRMDIMHTPRVVCRVHARTCSTSSCYI